MLIEFQCGNFSGFDKSRGTYVECGEKIIVSDEKIGHLVKCPKCQQEVEVPFGGGKSLAPSEPAKKPKPSGRPASKSQSSGSKSSRNKSTSQNNRTRNSASTRKSSSQPVGGAKKRRSGKSKTGAPQSISASSKNDQRRRSESGQRPSRPPVTGDFTGASMEDSGELFGAGDLALAEPVDRPSADVMMLDFAEEAVSPLVEDQTERCRKCGNIAKSGRCTVCNHVEPQFEKLHQPMKDIQIEVAGMQRWFCQTMNEGVSIRLLEYGAHIALSFLGLALMVLGMISLTGIALGTIGGMILLALLGCAAALYVGLIYKGRQFMRDPNARLAWFQRPFWNLVLTFSRALKWQGYDKRLQGRKVITIHDKMFGNHEIADLPGLKNCQVLDLEGTCITDQALLELYQLNHLRCLVVRKTNVTHEGVFRLQQSHPRLWIWY